MCTALCESITVRVFSALSLSFFSASGCVEPVGRKLFDMHWRMCACLKMQPQPPLSSLVGVAIMRSRPNTFTILSFESTQHLELNRRNIDAHKCASGTESAPDA